jgi:arylsulfatase A-like enzyme
MRRWPALLVAVALLGGACGRRATPPPGPRLVVLLVIDQLPSWAFDAREPLLRHGLRRLVDEGLLYARARYPYAATFTAPGHAALSTGAPPRVTGLLANRWYRRDLAAVVEGTFDPASPLLSGGRDPASPALLRVEGVADSLRAATGGRGKSVGISMKDRSAIFSLGRHPTLALWFDDDRLRFTTSRWYVATEPAWVAALPPIAPRVAGYVWQPLDAALLAAHAGIPDDAPGEPAPAVFPHRFRAGDAGVEEAMKRSPLSSEVTREVAEAAIAGEALGADEVADLLTISFSAHDHVGHRYGQESWECFDMLLRIDVEIGRLLATLDARVGRGRYAVILATDHGVTRMVEQSRARGAEASRIPWSEVERAAEEGAATVAGPGDWIASARDPSLFLSAAARALPAERRARLVEAAAAAVARIDGMAFAWPTAGFGDCAAESEPRRGVCWSIDPERSGEIYYGAFAGSIISGEDPEGTTHGSGNPDDAVVPLLLHAPGRIAPGRSDEPVSMLRVAPTLAALLGVPPPPAAREAPLVSARP